MGDSDKKCSVCGADSAGRTGKRAQTNSSGVSKLLIIITILSVIAALAVTFVFAVLPSINKPSEDVPPIEETETPDISVYTDAINNYTAFLNGKLSGEDIEKLLPKNLSDYLCSLYNFNKAEVMEAGYEKTSSYGIRSRIESYKDADISVTLEVLRAKECEDDIKNALKEHISQNFRTDIGEISEVSLLSVKISFDATDKNVPGVFSLTEYDTTLPMYGIKYGDSYYIADANGDMAFDEWDIHSYYSDYYMHN